VDRDRNEIAAHFVGNGTLGAAMQLYNKVRHHDIGIVATDGNYSYNQVIPRHIRHVVSKAETCLVEAKNSSLRGMLARLNRRTKRYSKCVDMLKQAVTMWRFPLIAQSIYI